MLRLLFQIFLIILFKNAACQDCYTLNNFTTFHGLKFGNKIPLSLRKICDKHYDNTSRDIMFSFTQQKIKNTEYEKWLNFGLTFTDFIVSVINDGRIYRFGLMLKFYEEELEMLKDGNYPSTYKIILNELQALFGEPTKTSIDPFGEGLSSNWECSEINISLETSFIFKYYYLDIKDKKLDKVRLKMKYK